MTRKKKPPDIQADVKQILADKYENHLSARRVVKTSLKSIIRHKKSIEIINELVCRMNIITIHTYHFIKLYCLYYYSKNNTMPVIDKNNIVLIIKVICGIKDNNRGRKFTEETKIKLRELTIFFDKMYSPIMGDKRRPTYENLGNILEYEATRIVTCIMNHIQEHFEDMLNRFVNIAYDKKCLDEKYSSKTEKAKTRTILGRVKKDLMYNENKSGGEHTKFINDFRNIILKGITINKSLSYMSKSNDRDKNSLLTALVRMSMHGEKLVKHRQTFEQKDELFKVINCFPMRKNIRPKNIDIDVAVLISNFNMGKNNRGKFNKKKIVYSDIVWNKIFKLDADVFKKNGYTLNRHILTDGVGCSLLFI